MVITPDRADFYKSICKRDFYDWSTLRGGLSFHTLRRFFSSWFVTNENIRCFNLKVFLFFCLFRLSSYLSLRLYNSVSQRAVRLSRFKTHLYEFRHVVNNGHFDFFVIWWWLSMAYYNDPLFFGYRAESKCLFDLFVGVFTSFISNQIKNI